MRVEFRSRHALSISSARGRSLLQQCWYATYADRARHCGRSALFCLQIRSLRVRARSARRLGERSRRPCCIAQSRLDPPPAARWIRVARRGPWAAPSEAVTACARVHEQAVTNDELELAWSGRDPRWSSFVAICKSHFDHTRVMCNSCPRAAVFLHLNSFA